MVDKDITQALDEAVRRIVATAHPVKVILFGSAARGAMESHSDFDFLVVVKNGTHRCHTAQAIYRALLGAGRAADIVVVTESDLNEHADSTWHVIRPALQEGKTLYAA